VNLWIPIAGVTENSSLRMVPGSHKLSEVEIVRTYDGGVVEGNTYRVRMIKEWAGSDDSSYPKMDEIINIPVEYHKLFVEKMKKYLD
jgi:ectoine hydroxylase-related dioxygenase (phytanoyl-CoA dioxygenase family)